MLPVDRGAAVAEVVVVLDVVVDERSLVEQFHRRGDPLDGLGQLGRAPRPVVPPAVPAAEGVVGRQRDEGPVVLAAAGEKIVGENLRRFQGRHGFEGLVGRFAQRFIPSLSRQQAAQLFGFEHPRGGAEQMDLRTCGAAPGPVGRVDHLQGPLLVGRSIGARGRVERHRHGRQPGDLELAERLLERIEAADSQDGVGLAPKDQLQHDRGAFGDQDLVASFAAQRSPVAQVAAAAVLATKPELIVLGPADRLVPHAVRQEQQTPLVGRGQHPIPPVGAGQHDHRPSQVGLRQMELFEHLASMAFHLMADQGQAAVEGGDACLDGRADLLAQRQRLGNLLQVGGSPGGIGGRQQAVSQGRSIGGGYDGHGCALIAVGLGGALLAAICRLFSPGIVHGPAFLHGARCCRTASRKAETVKTRGYNFS